MMRSADLPGRQTGLPQSCRPSVAKSGEDDFECE